MSPRRQGMGPDRLQIGGGRQSGQVWKQGPVWERLFIAYYLEPVRLPLRRDCAGW